MLRAWMRAIGPVVLGFALLSLGHGSTSIPIAAQAPGAGKVPPDQTPLGGGPIFELDTSFPKPLPNNWMTGPTEDVAIDSRDNVWLIHFQKGYQRPVNTVMNVARAGKEQAPAVLQFTPSGEVLRAWGGPLAVPPYEKGKPWKRAPYDWMESSALPIPQGNDGDHGITVDAKDNVWVTGNGDVVLKFTKEGKFLLQIGKLWMSGGNNHTEYLGNPTDTAIDTNTNLVFVADGYRNQRVIVFDATTGAYKRHWGAYGKRPPDYPPNAPLEFPDWDHQTLPQRYGNMHGIAVSRDGLVYVGDQTHNRVQVFKEDGTFVNEVFILKNTPNPEKGALPCCRGSVSAIALSKDPQQEYLFVGDSSNGNFKLWSIRRKDLRILNSLDLKPLGFATAHLMETDSKNNVYVASSAAGPKKLVFKGVAPTPTQ